MKLDSPSSPRFAVVFAAIFASALCVNCLAEPEVIFVEQASDATPAASSGGSAASGSGGSAASGSGGSATMDPDSGGDEGVPSNVCADLGYGFNEEGEFVEHRDSEDVAVPGRAIEPWEDFEGDGIELSCHAGDAVIGTTLDSSLIPEALGGQLKQGTYVLTEIEELESPAFGIVRNTFHQTLYVTSTSLGLLSDDNQIFTFTGTYLYDIMGSSIWFSPLTQTYAEAEFVPFTDEADFTATADAITLISHSRGFVAKYSRVPDLTISSDW